MKKLCAIFCLFFIVSTGLGNGFTYIHTTKKKSETHNECNKQQCIALEDELKSLNTRIAQRSFKVRKIDDAMAHYNGPYTFLGGAFLLSFINPAISFVFLGGAAVNIGNAHLVRPARRSWHRKMLSNLEKKRTEAQEKF